MWPKAFIVSIELSIGDEYFLIVKYDSVLYFLLRPSFQLGGIYNPNIAGFVHPLHPSSSQRKTSM